MSTPTSDYDATWKYLAERHLGDLIAHTFPALHRRIDWQRGMINHDRELAGLAVTATRALHSDRLIEVFLRPPRRRSLLVHLEFQSQVDPELSARLFNYAKRITDQFKQPYVPLVILADRQASWNPAPYRQGYNGNGLALRFFSWKLIAQPLEWVRQQNTLVAIVHRMILLSWTLRDDQSRLDVIADLFQQYIRLPRTDHDLTDFLRVAHRILPVSSARSGDIYATMRAILIKEGLMVQTSFLAPEELAAEARGEIQGQRQLLIKLLSRRFPQLSASDTAAVEHLAPAQLDQLADVLLSLADLQALRAWLAGQRD